MQPGSFNHDCHLYIQNYFLRTMRTWVGSALAAELHYKKTTLQKVNMDPKRPFSLPPHTVEPSAAQAMHAWITYRNKLSRDVCKGCETAATFLTRDMKSSSRKHIKYLGFLGRKWYTMCPNMCIFGLMWYRRRRWLHAWSASWFMADL